MVHHKIFYEEKVMQIQELVQVWIVLQTPDVVGTRTLFSSCMDESENHYANVHGV